MPDSEGDEGDADEGPDGCGLDGSTTTDDDDGMFIPVGGNDALSPPTLSRRGRFVGNASKSK